MLLPSDIARLVLGYLQQEGLTATSRAFILESPNLKEYAEHSSEDGVIPACVFSLFGKNLITILNEYVAIKAKETSEGNQIPVVMASLWKKLDFTLNQIKSMQNSPAVHLNQRLRTLNSIQYMRHQQRSLLSSQSPISGHLTPGATLQCVPSSVSNPQGMLGHSTPLSYTSQQTRPSALCFSQPGESPLQILVPDQRLNPGPLSPARRKCDSPRRRGGGQSGTSGTSRSTVLSSTLIVETPSEENTAENLSQIVIENAREKILNDRSLQEKLAENINKILASDNSPQTSKAACSSVEQEQSIDEILGLQGEIHMTDDAIQDILAQTESDPAFQALFDLFDCGKNKTAEGGEQADGSLNTSAQESDETGLINSVSESGTGQDVSTSVGENSPRKLRNQNTSESKNKNLPNKPSAIRNASRSGSTVPQPRAVKPAAPARGTPNSKRGLVRSRVLSGSKQTRGATSTTKSNNKMDSRPPDQTVSSSSYTEEGVAMEIDGPQNETSDTVSILIPELVAQESFPITGSQSDQVQVTSQPTSIAEASAQSNSAKETVVIIGMTAGQPGQNGNMTETSLSAVEAMPSIHLSEPVMDVSMVRTSPHSLNKMPLTPPCPQQTDKCGPPTAGSVNCLAPSLSTTTSAPSTSMCVSDALGKESDPSKIVSLKIIISDEQDVQSGDVMLNQAVSSITGDRIPTIFLSSPAKSPAKIQPTTSAVITQEETAQAVSSLQGVEGVRAFGTPSRNVPATAMARPTGQETGFIQLLPANPSFGPSGSYFVVTDPAAAEQRSNVVLLPGNMTQGNVSSGQHVVATPPRQRTVVSMAQNVSQTYSPGSTIIISSPVQPMLQNVMLPVSVVGQNTGKLTVLPNQMLSLPCSATVRPPAKVISQPKLAPKENTDTGKTGNSGSGPVSKTVPQTSEQQKSASESSPSHRRILCFDSKPENTTAAETSALTQHPQKDDKRTEPNRPLASGTSKRRIETIRLLSHNVGNKDSEISTISQTQLEGQKPKGAEKRTDLTVGRSSSKAASETESQKKSQPSNKGDIGAVSQSTKSSAPGQKQKSSGNTKDNAPEEPCEKRPSKPAEKSLDKMSLQVSPGVTANKENELKGSQQDLRQTTAQPPDGLESSAPKPATPVSGSSNKTLCKTSPLTKQAVEMLQDIQGQAPAATTPKRQGPDVPLPRTPRPGCTQEEPTDGLKTPSRQRPGRQGEGTPRYLPPPATPDIPSCSPASEAGSENSINMAAHTLMILSRAARTGGPLKDSLRQEEAGTGKSPTPKSKKRKHMEASPLAKKELQLSGSSGSKKKSKKQKKLLDSFPDDLDVDKFLSSLHYDE